MREMKNLICSECNSEFQSIIVFAKTCSKTCSTKRKSRIDKESGQSGNCCICGEEFWVRRSNSKSIKTCGKSECIKTLKNNLSTPEKRKKTGEKISKAMTGKKFSEERKKEYSEKFSGSGNPRFGIKIEKETSEAISEGLKKYYAENKHVKTKDRVERECLFCKNLFKDIKDGFRERTFCGMKCKIAHQIANKPPPKIHERICARCNISYQEFGKKKTKYCSKICREGIIKKNIKHQCICEECNENFIYTGHNSGKRFCSRSCSTKNIMKNMDIEKKKEYSKRISESQKENFRTGRKIHAWVGRKHSDKTKERISKTRIKNKCAVGSKNVMFGKTHNAASREKISNSNKNILKPWLRNLNGKFFSEKNQIDFIYRSSWELEVFKFLENSEDVLSYKSEPFAIKYDFERDYLRNYHPDIFIEYKDGTKKLIEIKPEPFQTWPINLAKFAAGRDYCRKNNVVFEVWGKVQIDEIKTRNQE